VHDTESGVVLIDRLRHSDVLHYLWYINTFAPEVRRVSWRRTPNCTANA